MTFVICDLWFIILEWNVNIINGARTSTSTVNMYGLVGWLVGWLVGSVNSYLETTSWSAGYVSSPSTRNLALEQHIQVGGPVECVFCCFFDVFGRFFNTCLLFLDVVIGIG